jgi:ABC-2 type transport system permease protein
MNKTLKVAWREYKSTVRTKGFIIGLVLAPVVMSGSGIVMALTRDRIDTRDKTIAVIDKTGLLTDALVAAAEERNAAVVFDRDTGEKVRAAYAIEVVTPSEANPEAQRLALSNRVRRRQLHAFVEIGAGVVHPRENSETGRVSYYGENAAIDDVRSWLSRPLNDALRRIRLSAAGVDEATVPDLFDYLSLEPLGLVTVDSETGEIRAAERSNELGTLLPPIATLMLMFVMIMMGAVPQLNSVMEEKSQRIAEVMLGSVKPFEFMMGKLIGGVSVSLTAAIFYVALGTWAVHYYGVAQYVPFDILPWFFVYLVSAVFMVGALQAALGSACNDASEAQALAFPAMLPVMIPMFVMMPVLIAPTSTFATSLSLFPLFTPFLMLLRQSTDAAVPGWQPLVGLIGIALTTVLFVWVGGRIFRVGLLMRGTPPKLGNILRWAVRG